MNKRSLLLSLLLLPLLLALPSASRAQYVVTGQGCGASGLSAIANDGTPVVCRGNPLVWTAVGGGGGGSPTAPSPIMGFYLSPACKDAGIINAFCFNTFADTQQYNDASWTTSNGIITFNSNEAFPGMVGMSVMGAQTCAGDWTLAVATGGSIAPNATPPTVLTYNSPTSITISATPANASSFSSTPPLGSCIVIGHPDDTGATAVDAALSAISTYCPKLFLAAANYWFSKPHFFTNPPGCQNTGMQLDGTLFTSGLGSVTLPGGFEIEGRGVGNTAWYLGTNFPNGDSCQHTPYYPASSGFGITPIHSGACFAIPAFGKWRDFRIDGAGQGAPTGLQNHTLGPYLSIGYLENFLCLNYGGYTGSNSVGMEIGTLSQLNNVNNSGCGAIGIWIDSGITLAVGYRVVVESSASAAIDLAGGAAGTEDTFTCYWCGLATADSAPFGPPQWDILNNGARVKLYGGFLNSCNGNSSSCTQNGQIGYSGNSAGSVLYSDGVTFTFTVSGASNNASSIVCTAACTNYLQNTNLSAQSAGNTYKDVAGSILVDEGGNKFSGGTVSILGAVVNESLSANTLAVTAAKLVLSAGWGASAANTALSGGDFPIQFTITNTGAGQGASPTITYTFPTPLPVAPFSCTATDLSGTNPLLNPFTTSALSATGATFTATGTPTLNDTEVMQITCVTP